MLDIYKQREKELQNKINYNIYDNVKSILEGVPENKNTVISVDSLNLLERIDD